MGQLIKLKPEMIKPSQNFLKRGTVQFIFDCYKKRETDSLPPAPMVRKHPNKPDTYVAIDGHNLLAVHEFFGTECEIYFVDSANDYLPNPSNKESIAQRNKNLTDKYESCVLEADKIKSSFQELVQKFLLNS